MRVDEKHIVVTGLSRSGKSTLFTSLIAQLIHRSKVGAVYDGLPLLSILPSDRVVDIQLYELKDHQPFPYLDNMNALTHRQWPPSTTQVSAFAVEITMTKKNKIWQLFGNHTVRLVIHDYPGEWLMDLPMIQQSFTDWSAHVLAQQLSEPQFTLSQSWQQVLKQFNFDETPTEQHIQTLVDAYRAYLVQAKQDGISMLQPGALLLQPAQLDATVLGFCPLPSKITCNPSHPWFMLFQKRYQKFIKQWVIPFRNQFFRHSDKQIILLDVLEGLNYGRDYLAEMQEATSHLVSSFIYGKRKWYEILHRPLGISKVAFAATKIDLIPQKEHPNLLSLLKQLTEGAMSHLQHKDVQFDHFLITAICATKIDEDASALLYKNLDGQSCRVTFDPIPDRMKHFSEQAHYPFLKAMPPVIRDESDIRSIHLDTLLDYMLRD